MGASQSDIFKCEVLIIAKQCDTKSHISYVRM